MLILRGASAYVLVDSELIGEYLLAKSRQPDGGIGLSSLSGTNKDYGTRCEMTNIQTWGPE